MEQNNKISSHEVRPFTAEERSRRKKCANDAFEYIRIGPQGYVFPSSWLEHAEEIRNTPLRNTDTWVVAFPRSGTTWTQELVWLVNNDMNFEKAQAVPLFRRYQFLDSNMTFNPFAKVSLKDCRNEKSKKALMEIMTPVQETLAKTPSPRFIKSHLPLSLLPDNILDTSKVVYVARDPRDVAVSCYHISKIQQIQAMHCEFKEYFDLFVSDLTINTPIFKHVKEAWAQRNHPNMLFLFYEELSKDQKNTAKKVADFFGKTYTEQQFDQLCGHLAFKNFQNNNSVSYMEFVVDSGFWKRCDFSKNFVRRGKAGGWRDYFDAEMTAQAQAWMQHNLQDTDLRFPLQEF